MNDPVIGWGEVEISVSGEAAAELVHESYDFGLAELTFHEDFYTFSRSGRGGDGFGKSLGNSDPE